MILHRKSRNLLRRSDPTDPPGLQATFGKVVRRWNIGPLKFFGAR